MRTQTFVRKQFLRISRGYSLERDHLYAHLTPCDFEFYLWFQGRRLRGWESVVQLYFWTQTFMLEALFCTLHNSNDSLIANLL